MKRKRLVVLVVIAVLAMGGAWFGVSWFKGVAANHQREIEALSVSDVDLARLPDGTYTGRCLVFPVSVEVKVSVADHRIEEIELVKHRNGRGSPAEIIPEKVVQAQSLAVDTVAGATSSSKVILKAIEDALKSAVK